MLSSRLEPKPDDDVVDVDDVDYMTSLSALDLVETNKAIVVVVVGAELSLSAPEPSRTELYDHVDDVTSFSALDVIEINQVVEGA